MSHFWTCRTDTLISKNDFDLSLSHAVFFFMLFHAFSNVLILSHILLFFYSISYSHALSFFFISHSHASHFLILNFLRISDSLIRSHSLMLSHSLMVSHFNPFSFSHTIIFSCSLILLHSLIPYSTYAVILYFQCECGSQDILRFPLIQVELVHLL